MNSVKMIGLPDRPIKLCLICHGILLRFVRVCVRACVRACVRVIIKFRHSIYCWFRFFL